MSQAWESDPIGNYLTDLDYACPPTEDTIGFFNESIERLAPLGYMSQVLVKAVRYDQYAASGGDTLETEHAGGISVICKNVKATFGCDPDITSIREIYAMEVWARMNGLILPVGRSMTPDQLQELHGILENATSGRLAERGQYLAEGCNLAMMTERNSARQLYAQFMNSIPVEPSESRHYILPDRVLPDGSRVHLDWNHTVSAAEEEIDEISARLAYVAELVTPDGKQFVFAGNERGDYRMFRQDPAERQRPEDDFERWPLRVGATALDNYDRSVGQALRAAQESAFLEAVNFGNHMATEGSLFEMAIALDTALDSLK